MLVFNKKIVQTSNTNVGSYYIFFPFMSDVQNKVNIMLRNPFSIWNNLCSTTCGLTVRALKSYAHAQDRTFFLSRFFYNKLGPQAHTISTNSP